VVEKRTIIKAPLEIRFLAGPFPSTFPPADIKLGAFLPLVGLLVATPARNCSEELDRGQYLKVNFGRNFRPESQAA
jgi:hypothetical protein